MIGDHSMNANSGKSASNERAASTLNGWVMLTVNLVLLLGAMAWFIWIITQSVNSTARLGWMVPAMLVELLAILLLCGHFTLQPNEARVLSLFGAYKGTVRTSGFWWANPFYSRIRAKIPVHPTVAVQHSAHGGHATSVVHITR